METNNLETLAGMECLGELCSGVDRRVLRRIWTSEKARGVIDFYGLCT